MILKGSQRGHGSDLATHLCNEFDNERIELAEVRGTVATDLHGFAAEVEAVAAGTKATQPFFSVSINPRETLTRDQYFAAIGEMEQRFGLSGQPRAVIFHEKTGADGVTREHAHIVWSRIDAQKMRAIPLSHFKARLCDLACDLAHEFGHELPEGLKAWAEKRARKKEQIESSLADIAAQEKTGISAGQRREQITAIWQSADSAAAFRNALEEQGYILARGDRRDFVIVDESRQVHSLSRQIDGARAKDIRARLAPLDDAAIPSVDDARRQMTARMEARADRLREQSDIAAQIEADLRRYEKELRAKLRQIHRARREKLEAERKAMTSRQLDEKMMLAAAQTLAAMQVGFKVRTAVIELIEKVPGLRSVLAPLQKLGLDPRAHQQRERDALATRHKNEQREIGRNERALEKIEAREAQSLARKVERKRRLAEAEGIAGLQVSRNSKQQQEDHRQRYDQPQSHSKQTDRRLLGEDGLSRRFRDAAKQSGDDGDAEGDGDDRFGWKKRAEGYRRGHHRGGYRHGHDRHVGDDDDQHDDRHGDHGDDDHDGHGRDPNDAKPKR